MTGKEKIDALQAACRSLGLRAVRNNSADWIVLDAERCKYTCLRSDMSSSAVLRGLDEFLAVRYFEHYRYPHPGVFKIVENRFFGMSREELLLRLDVAGA